MQRVTLGRYVSVGRALAAAGLIAASLWLGAYPDRAGAIEPRRERDTVEEPTEPPRQREAPRDFCVQARADWASISTTTDAEVLASFIRTLPAQCRVQRAQAERRLAIVQADATRPPILYASIAIGDRATGTLARGDGRLTTDEYADGYRFAGRRGQRVAIDLRSAAFDAYLILIPPSGAQIDVDDTDGLGTNSRIEHTLQQDGEYIILATSFQAGETGAYELQLGMQAAPSPPAASVSYPPPAGAPLADPAGGLIWTALPDEQTLRRVYPLAARSQQREGRVVLSCRVNTDSTAACTIASEQPAGLGFGNAALEASHSLRVAALRSDGSSSAGTQTEVILNFRLDQISTSP